MARSLKSDANTAKLAFFSYPYLFYVVIHDEPDGVGSKPDRIILTATQQLISLWSVIWSDFFVYNIKELELNPDEKG